jgi:hypothetical protein
MSAMATLKSGVMKTKQHAQLVEPNGNAPIRQPPVSNIVNMQTNVEE